MGRNLRGGGGDGGVVARLLGRFDIDAGQWRALFVAGLKLDFRAPLAEAGGGSSVTSRIAAQVAMYLVMGVFLGVFAYFVPDVFLSSSILVSALMFFIASAVLIEFAVVVISPLDYDVLGYQPISSATYFAARFSNALFYTTAITTVISLPPVLAYLFARGFNPLVAAAALAACYLASTTTTAAVIVAYVGIAQLVKPDRLKRVLTYVQLVVSFAVYGAYFVLPNVFHLSTLRTFTVTKSPWMLVYPPTWYASYLDLAIGRVSLMEILPALAGFGALAFLAWLSAARLSLNYSALISREAFSTEARRPERRRRFRFRLGRGEQRAVALLVSAQFRNDQRFRLAVLSIVPMTILYLFMGVREGGLHDPFVASEHQDNAFLLYFAMVMFPSMLIMSITRSDAYRAAWVFFVTPARRAQLVMATKNLALAYFVAPYLFGLFLVLAYFFGNALHAFIHMAVEGLIVNLVLLAVVALQPELPFSLPVQKGQRSGALIAVMMVGAIVQSASTIALALVVYPYPLVLGSVIAGLSAAALIGQRLLRRRLERVTGDLEFAG